jgi:hypothetical protein
MAGVKLCYALRRGVFYPSARDEFGEMPPASERRRYLPLVKAMGFAAVEVPVDEAADRAAATELVHELTDAGLDIGCVRAGGGLAHPLASPSARAKLDRTPASISAVCGRGVVWRTHWRARVRAPNSTAPCATPAGLVRALSTPRW